MPFLVALWRHLVGTWRVPVHTSSPGSARDLPDPTRLDRRAMSGRLRRPAGALSCGERALREGREGRRDGQRGLLLCLSSLEWEHSRTQDLIHTSIIKLYQALDMQGEARQESGGGHIRVTLGNR